MPLEYLPHLPATADLVVIGGGVVGAATAFHAARAGLRPLILERRPRLCTLTTPASTGAFRLQFDNEEELRMVQRSVDLFMNFQDVTGQTDYHLAIRRQGYLWVTTETAGVERQRRLVESQREWGLTDVEILDGEEARRRFPFVSPEVLQARFRSDDGFLDPKALTMGLASASSAAVVTDCGVTGFRTVGGRLTAVSTQAGEVATECAVIAAGPFSGVLAAETGVSLPVEIVPRQKVVLPAAPEVPEWAPLTIDEDTGVHWRPALRGAYLLFADPATPAAQPVEDVPLDHRFAFRLLDPKSPVAAARTAPFWARLWERSSTYWLLQAGQYTVTPDHRPLIGPTPVDGLWVNTGYSGHGIMAAPAASAVLVDVLTGRSSPETNPFRLDRVFRERDRDVL